MNLSRWLEAMTTGYVSSHNWTVAESLVLFLIECGMREGLHTPVRKKLIVIVEVS